MMASNHLNTDLIITWKTLAQPEEVEDFQGEIKLNVRRTLT